MVRRSMVVVMLLTNAAALAQTAPAPVSAPARALSFDQTIADHPAHDVLLSLFANKHQPAPARFAPTKISRKDYLTLMADEVDFWKHHQDDEGRIIDFYEFRERQYSTPAFALAASLLVADAKREDLFDAATRAFSHSLEELATHTTADNHADFYIPMLMHAYRILKTREPADLVARWDEQFKSIIPEKTYMDRNAGGNWNLVHVSGEFLRRRDGLVAPDQRDAQVKYLMRALSLQEKRFTAFGMYTDPAVPLAYDAFPRLWLEDALADGAIEGEWNGKLTHFLAKGGFSTLLLLSPSGEWACGGRSAHHQWNEAENAEICEINAVKWKNAGRLDIAGAFKRAAHLCLSSMLRWQRPSGEMWIVKNFADPSRRHGFEGYSFNSQYNLLPMAMLAIAYERADDSIDERPIPSESDGYVFDLRDPFHHVVAAAGGYYALIDTQADPHYGSTGLQRIHRAGVDLSPFTDTPAPESVLGPPEAFARGALSAGLQWKLEHDDRWHNLGEFGFPQPAPKPSTTTGKAGKIEVIRATVHADLVVHEQAADGVHFAITYHATGPSARTIEQDYKITSEGVECTERLAPDAASALRVVLPALVNDGARDTDVRMDRDTVTITRRGALFRRPGTQTPFITKPGGKLTWQITTPLAGAPHLEGPNLLTHNGFVRALVADLPRGTREVTWHMTLEPDTRGTK